MNKKTVFAASATAAIMALGVMATNTPANAGDTEMEKCYGVVKAGSNDCGNSAHSCAGHAATDNAGDEWVYLPKGTLRKTDRW